MTQPIGNKKINLHPCTEEQEAQNLQVIKNSLQQITEQFVTIVAGSSDHKFCTVSDTAGDAPGFSSEKFYPSGSAGGDDLPVYFQTATVSGDVKLTAFIKYSDLPAGVTGDTFKVRVDGADTEDFLINKVYPSLTLSDLPAESLPISFYEDSDLLKAWMLPDGKVSLNMADTSRRFLIDNFANQASYAGTPDEVLVFFSPDLGDGSLHAFVTLDDLSTGSESMAISRTILIPRPGSGKIAAATYASDGKITPTVVSANTYARDIDGNYVVGDSEDYEYHLVDDVPISTDKVLVGHALKQDGVWRLDIESCKEVDPPA